MNNLLIFKNDEFGEVRTVTIDGEPWFVGKDVAEALGYADTADALKRHVDDEDNFPAWAKKCITKIAESPKFKSGLNRSHKYASAWNESYDRLKEKRNCRLDDRLERARGRALNRGWTQTKCKQEISKLTIIQEDKNLRPVYESVIREMMVHYCVDGGDL